jgi:hypothetical protein
MSTAEEWKQHKLKSLEHLRGLTFTFADYTPPSPEWDHDHCECCWAKFALFEAPEILHSGYFIIVKLFDESTEESEVIQHAQESGRTVLLKPDTKEWVCPKCFQAFRVALGWKLKSKPQV